MAFALSFTCTMAQDPIRIGYERYSTFIKQTKYAIYGFMKNTGSSAIIYGLVILMFWPYSFFAQSKASMEQVDAAFSLIFSNPSEALLSLNQLEAITRKQNDSLYAIVLNNKGVYHATLNNLDQAIYYFEKASIHKACNAVRQVKIKNNLAIIYKKKGLYTKSFDLFKAAENLALAIDNPELLALIYGEKASLYSTVQANEDAVKNLLRSIAIFETLEHPNPVKIGIEQQKLGNLYLKMGQFKFALELFTTSALALEASKRQDAYGLVLACKAETYLLTSQPEKALKAVTEAQAILLRFNNAEWDSYVHEILARYYLQTKEWDLAEKSFELSLKASSEHKVPRALHTFTLWAEAVFLRQNWDKLMSLYTTYEKQLPTWLLRASLADKKGFYELDAKWNERLSYFDRSNASLNKAIELSDSLQHLNHQNRILNLQWKYQTQEKERKNLILEQALKLEQRHKWIGFLSSILLLISIYFFWKHAAAQKQLKLKELEELQIQIHLAASEIEQAQKLDELKQVAIKDRESHLLEQALENIALQEQLDDIIQTMASEDKQSVSTKVKVIKKQAIPWSSFLEKFQTVNPDFNQRLLQVHDTLTKTEVEFCAMIRLNMSSKDIARILGIRPESVFTKKYRLMKKLNLPKDTDLFVWLTSL